MKKSNITNGIILAIACALLSTTTWAQSPGATATGKVAGATITITYSSPSVKGRKIYGGLVPFNEVWRTGANKATIIETDKTVKVEGKALAAGKYSLYAIPGEKEWTIIINSQTGQWGINHDGSTTRDVAKDVITVTAKPAKTASLVESMTFEVNDKGFSLKWENTEVPVSVK